MLNSENKTKERFLQTISCKSLNDFFALKICRILHIENLTSNKIFRLSRF